VTLVGGVPVPVVDIVDMTFVRDRDVPAPRRVLVLVRVVRGVLGLLALVGVVAVGAVQVAVVRVIGVVAVRDGDVPAPLAVGMRVIGVRVVLGGDRHPRILPRRSGRPALHERGEPLL
jgi:hypothetical protein